MPTMGNVGAPQGSGQMGSMFRALGDTANAPGARDLPRSMTSQGQVADVPAQKKNCSVSGKIEVCRILNDI